MAKVRTLNFEALIPDRHKFVDAGGEEYEFMNPEDMGAEELARLNKLRKRIQAFFDEEEDDEQAGQQFDQDVTAVLQIVLPELPAKRLDTFKLGQKSKMLEFWFDATEGETGEPDTEGETEAD